MSAALKVVGAVAVALLVAAATATAQAPQTLRIRGQIEAMDGPMLTIKARDGSVMNVKLADNPRITAMLKASLADIKPGAFIGVTAMPQPDGSQKAIGLHIFMDAQRGVVPARFMPWDREPGSTMTNADVKSTVASVDGQVIMVKYPDGEKKNCCSSEHARRCIRAGQCGRPQAGRADDHHRCPEIAGRLADGARHQCRPRRRRAADVNGKPEGPTWSSK